MACNACHTNKQKRNKTDVKKITHNKLSQGQSNGFLNFNVNDLWGD